MCKIKIKGIIPVSLVCGLFIWCNVSVGVSLVELNNILNCNEEILLCEEVAKDDLTDGINDLRKKTEELKVNMGVINSELVSYQKERNKNILADRSNRHSIKYGVLDSSNVSEDQIDFLVQGTGLQGLGESYLRAENETGIDALFLLALSIHESSWGESNFSRERNNVMGYRAYTSSPGNAKHFNTKADCIMEVARHLEKNYLTEGGKYFCGYTIRDINKNYATDSDWCTKIENIMVGLGNKLRGNKRVE